MARARRRLSPLSPQRRSEVWGVLLLAVSLFLLMSLLSFDPNDSAFFTSHPSPQARNLCGVVGAWAAGLVRITLGWTGYLLPLLGFLWAVSRFNGRPAERPLLRGLGTLLLLVSVSGFLSIVWVQDSSARILRGGVVGLMAGDQSLQYFGWWGAVTVLLTLGLLCLLLSTELVVWPVLQAGGEGLFQGARWLGRRGSEAAASLAGRIGSRRTTVVHRAGMTPGRLRAGAESRATASVQVAEESEAPEPKEELAAAAPPKIRGVEVEPLTPPPAPVRHSTGSARTEGPARLKAVRADSGEVQVRAPYQLPTLDLLNTPVASTHGRPTKEMVEQSAKILEESLRGFGIEVKVAEVELGPVITRYELEPAPGVKIQQIATLSNDLALSLKASSVRVIAPIPGKGRVGVEVPNPSSALVTLREVLESKAFQQSKAKLTMAIGKDTAGYPLVADLGGMPHLLVAGATGSGKTVCMNALIISILFNASPEEVRFLMVDPKMVELSVFNGLPHLVMPVLTNPKKVPAALEWVIEEMETRYRLFAKLGVRNIEGYHEKRLAGQLPSEEIPSELPYLVVIIDELADLMLVAQADAERAIARLAHLSRAVGIHMVLATQRPSVDVLTGVIKANFPARISFQVASRVDSRTVLDEMGAEKLLGKGDLLFMPPGSSRLVRAQGTLVTDEEIERVVQFVKQQREPSYEVAEMEEVETQSAGRGEYEKDPLYDEALRVIVESGQASVSLLQRRMRLGYGRAARILDRMEEEGIVGPIRGARPREVFLKELPGRPSGVPK